MFIKDMYFEFVIFLNQIEGKSSVKSCLDSGIVVSMLFGSYFSYFSFEVMKELEIDDIDEVCFMEILEMIDWVEKVMVYKYINFKSIWYVYIYK